MTTDNPEQSDPTRYFVDLEGGGGGSVALLISDRRSFLSRQHDTIEEASSADPLLMMDQVAAQSSDADYLLPDTPLKEAVFRVILANGNDPMSPEEISEELKRRWTMSAYPRNLSPPVVERLLENMDAYSIASVAPAEPEPEPEPPPEPEPAAEEPASEEDEAAPVEGDVGEDDDAPAE